MIAVIDYGVGNMFSLLCSLKAVGAQGVLTFDETEIKNAEKIILPGVGAFADARLRLYQTGLSSVVQEEALNGKPLLGVCLGMQLLFEKSFENGEYEGLGLIPGEVVSFKGAIDSKLKIPQIGWNSLIFLKTGKKAVCTSIPMRAHMYILFTLTTQALAMISFLPIRSTE
ncbi:MAG: imidazole glycerol phosphate synthase subunit HisH [Acutalibacteraceae bacterium]